MNEVAGKIFELLPNNGARLSGSQIKATLGLRDLEYKAAKDELKAAGLVILGRGRSGTMALADPTEEASESQPNIVRIGQTASQTIWAEVEKKIKFFNCHCDLVPGMSYEELIELEEGCTGTRQRAYRFDVSVMSGVGFGFVCPVLDYYRTKMYKFRKKEEEIFDENIL